VISINLFTLAIGTILFLRLRRDMRKKQVPNAPDFPILLLSLGFCGWLGLLLTFLFRPLTGAASVEYFILLLPMPLLILGCIGWLLPLRKISRYHRYALAGSVLYLVIPACVWMFLLPSIIHTK
jgi:hypothetical protein